MQIERQNQLSLYSTVTLWPVGTTAGETEEEEEAASASRRLASQRAKKWKINREKPASYLLSREKT